MAIQSMLVEMPLLTLYGDGQIVTPARWPDTDVPLAMPELLGIQLNEDGIQAILNLAQDAGLLDRDFHSGGEALGSANGATTTSFTVTANGQTLTSSVYDLNAENFAEDATDAAREGRGRLRTFLDQLIGRGGQSAGLSEDGVFDTSWLPAGSVVGVATPYVIDRLEVIVAPAGPASAVVVWPLTTPPSAIGIPFKEDWLDGGRCAVVTGGELETMRSALADAAYDLRFESEGQQFVVFARPLLPDETGCAMSPADLYTGSPGWLPDGSRLVFDSNHEGQSQIYTVNVDCTDLTRLTIDGGLVPRLSPTGEWIAYITERDGGVGLSIMRADGSNQTIVSHAPIFDNPPIWSPDGTLLAFHARDDGREGIYVVDADGSDRRIVVDTSGLLVYSLRWMPNSQQLAYSRNVPASAQGPKRSLSISTVQARRLPARTSALSRPATSPLMAPASSTIPSRRINPPASTSRTPMDPIRFSSCLRSSFCRSGLQIARCCYMGSTTSSMALLLMAQRRHSLPHSSALRANTPGPPTAVRSSSTRIWKAFGASTLSLWTAPA